MDAKTIYDVVIKLTGSIAPVGESTVDNRRYDNLQTMIKVVDMLLNDIDDLIALKGNQAYSLARAGKAANEFFDKLGITNNHIRRE